MSSDGFGDSHVARTVDPRVGVGMFLGACRSAYRIVGALPTDELTADAVRIVMRGIVLDPDDPVLADL